MLFGVCPTNSFTFLHLYYLQSSKTFSFKPCNMGHWQKIEFTAPCLKVYAQCFGPGGCVFFTLMIKKCALSFLFFISVKEDQLISLAITSFLSWAAKILRLPLFKDLVIWNCGFCRPSCAGIIWKRASLACTSQLWSRLLAILERLAGISWAEAIARPIWHLY